MLLRVNLQGEWFSHASCFLLIVLGLTCVGLVAYISCFLASEHFFPILPEFTEFVVGFVNGLNMITHVRGLWFSKHIFLSLCTMPTDGVVPS